MKDHTKLVLAGGLAAAASAAATAAAIYGISSAMLHVALDRQEPKIMARGKSRISGCSEMLEALTELAAQKAKYLHQCNTATVELVARDGTPLVGHWYENPNAKRVVVAMHGWRSSWDQDFGFVAPFLHEQGCSVLYAEQRGQNESGGAHMTFGLLERFDCLDWVNWVCERTPAELPVYLAGISMGATTVLMAAGLELPDRVHGIVADCGFTSPHAIWAHVARKNFHLPYGLHRSWVDTLCRHRLRIDPTEASTVEAMRHCRVPVLFVHGSEDCFVPVSMTYQNYRACAAPKELLIVPGAGHGMSYLLEPERYRHAVHRFWKTHDDTL